MEQASWDEAGAWEAEDYQFEGSFEDEDEGEAFNLTGTQLNKSPCLREKCEKNSGTSKSNHA